jgi:Allene oxide cyclase barrel like domain
MTRKLGIVGAVMALGALAFGLGVATASSGITGPVIITVVEHATTDKIIDVGKRGDSTGDILTFHNDVYDETDTTNVGTDQGQCTRESPRAGTWECWWTTSLADGQITIEGPYLDASNTVLAAVTGGTGLYANARGSMEASCHGSECTMTFSLVP